MEISELKKFDFAKAFEEVSKELNVNWNVKGLLTEDGQVIALGSDSKLISRIFELLNNSILKTIAEKYGFVLETSPSQTSYPDFSFYDKECKKYIAIDVKTTYKEPNSNSELVFTLGSYASYLRNNTKNIHHPYSDYVSHYDICFIYSRKENNQEGQVFLINELNKIETPYDNVIVFVKERYKLSGEKPGSGNTENIGSFKLRTAKNYLKYDGPFALLGNEIFEHYWQNYPKYRDDEKEYTNINEYLDWREKQGLPTKELRVKYKEYLRYKQNIKD